MPTDVLMPQMGESVAEGTVTKWLKKVGESVGKDEPLFEISTEKVDAEIPSPVAGVLTKILVPEGQTVTVRSVVAQLEPAAPEEATPQPSAPGARPSAAGAPETLPTAPAAAPPGTTEREEEAAPVRTSPLVRRLAKEQGVDLNRVEGTGPGGRITKEDLLAYIEKQKAPPSVAEEELVAGAAPAAGPGPATREEILPMSLMRKRIAEHMVLSRRTSAHVTTVFQVDLTRVAEAYQKGKERFERQENTRLSYTPFFVRAVLDALKRFPILNSSVSGDNIVFKKDIHMGIAVALEGGLIVPVIHDADKKSFRGLTRAIHDLAERARSKKLTVAEVQGGTFTITNPGVYGSLFATPIINQPQVGIVGVGTVYQAPVVIQDAIAIRPVVHLSLSYDHRIIDGAVADQFLAAVKRYLENWEEDLWA